MKYTDLDRQVGIPKFDEFDIIGDMWLARKSMASERHAERVPGTVRGGSIGAIIDGTTHGVCHRKAYLRFNGIETPLDGPIDLMVAQGEKNEDIFLEELRHKYKDTEFTVKDQTEFECLWELPGDIKGSGSPDICIWDKDKPVIGIENKNIGSISKVKSTHYELKPDPTHVIQAANYSLRMGDMYCGGEPLPYRLIYSNRNMYHFFAMSEAVKKIILQRGWDINYSFGRPMTIGCFHREYLLDWDIDGRLRYWTAGYKDWVVTHITRESIDLYYTVVAKKMDTNNTLGPKPAIKHIDGSKHYSQCSYCDFKNICADGDRLTPQEFKDRGQILAAEMWKERLDKDT